ncbi:MAG: hypothetical protein KIT11_10030 [Fimbriimonadaceae bacterium]|nr:hypothetical protein [Fimbriimonadaceae bacterium]QYK55662.1 MAG: hypothetical protein KF733_11700 [Fimbriimonadaceae bacterium]
MAIGTLPGRRARPETVNPAWALHTSGEAMLKRKRGCQIGVGIVVLAFLLALPWMVQVVAAFRDFQRAGFLEQGEERKYQGSVDANLTAIRAALLLYVDSEGAFPPRESWMDAAWLRLQSGDMSKEEAKKKLRDPSRAKGESDYGFALNPAVAGKHPDDLPGETPLVWQSEGLEWNSATGPKAKGREVRVDGALGDAKSG